MNINELQQYEEQLIMREKALNEYANNLQEKENNLNFKDIFEKAKNYTTTIISVGYASLFILLTNLKTQITFSKHDLSFIAFYLIISICSFIAWEVFNMFVRSFHIIHKVASQKSKWLKFYIGFWVIILFLTIIPAGMVI